MTKTMRNIILSMLAVAMLFLQPVQAFATSDAEPYADPLQESDKFYQSGEVETPDYITVVFEDAGKAAKSALALSDFSEQLAFEADLSAEDARSQYHAQEEEIAQEANERAKKTLTLDRAAYNFVVAFTNAMYHSFVTKEKPDLEDFYDLSVDARNQNMFLVEHYAYQQAIIQPFTATSVSNEIAMRNVTELDDGVLLLEYRVTSTLDTDSEGNPAFAQHEQAYLIPTNDGYKLIKYWVQHIDFVSLQEDITAEVSFGAKSTVDYAAELLQDYETKAAANINLAATEDAEFEEELDNLSAAPGTRAYGIAYNRSQVRLATYQYALSDNPRFVRIPSDCTNFASQCMWQSPSWTFDTIGGSANQKWSCTRQPNGQYYRDIPVWSGVPGLWGYAQTNDNSSYGTVHGISCTTSGYSYSNVEVGDIIQLYEPGVGWHHSIVVVNVGNRSSTSSILCCAHSADVEDKSLSAYINGPTFTQYRVIHVNQYIVN